jgi:hypothetical protein
MYGCLCSEKETIGQAFIEYYQDLFTSGSSLEVEACTQVLTQKVSQEVSQEMNNKLVAEFSMEEISTTLNQMPLMKAPGPDGFLACFYKHNWVTIHQEVFSVILNFFHSGVLDGRVNTTHIALIPKKKNPEHISEFRPISLCHVVYKVISKVLANRLKLILPDLISPLQSAFIPGRLITDNILATYETLHSMQTRMWGKIDFMGVKLNISKAYDRVKWTFLEAIMVRMGFHTE